MMIIIGYIDRDGRTVTYPWILPLPWYFTVMEWTRNSNGVVIASCIVDRQLMWDWEMKWNM